MYDDVSVSRLHADVAAVLTRLGIQHEMEVLTDDEYFSLDIYLPEYDVAVEVDGPSHFMEVMTEGRRRQSAKGDTEAKADDADEAKEAKEAEEAVPAEEAKEAKEAKM